MSSSDDEAPSPDLGASSSKDPPPPLDSESSDEEEEVHIPKSKKSYKRPRIEWREVLALSKGDDATMREDEMRLQIHVVFKFRILCASYLVCLLHFYSVLISQASDRRMPSTNFDRNHDHC